MPAKKDPQAAAAAKAHAAKKAKALEDKTFGLKNKNKSVKVQKCAPAPSRPRACGLTVPARARPLGLTPASPLARAPPSCSYVSQLESASASSSEKDRRAALADPNSKESKAVCHAPKRGALLPKGLCAPHASPCAWVSRPGRLALTPVSPRRSARRRRRPVSGS